MCNECNKINGKSKFSDDVLNKHIKEKIGYLNDLKKQFGYNQDLINKLALMNVALKENGLEIDNLFYNTLMETEIFLTSEHLKDIYYKITGIKHKFRPSVTGIFNRDITTKILDEKYIPEPSKIFVARKYGEKVLNNIGMYTCIIHEIRHALTSQIDDIGFINNDIFFYRCGLNLDLLFDGDEFVSFGININEAFNETASVNIVNTILNYKNNFLENEDVKYLINNLKKDIGNNIYNGYAYEFQRQILAPLFKNEHIMRIAEYAEFTGDFEDFYDIFEDFVEYSNNLDKIVIERKKDVITDDFREKVRSFIDNANELAKYKIK